MRGFTLHRKKSAGVGQVLWAACKPNQTSADAYFDGRYNGAFTYFLLKALSEGGAQQLRKGVIAGVRKALAKGFDKVPQLECSASKRKTAIGS